MVSKVKEQKLSDWGGEYDLLEKILVDEKNTEHLTSNVWGFPAHGPSIGLNANARIGWSGEWERVRGNIVFGIGDNSVLRRYAPTSAGTQPGPHIKASFHWDLEVLGANLYIDDKIVVENGEIKV